jgi:hypothetical protein
MRRLSKHTPNTQWNPSRIQEAFGMALLGFTDKQIAEEMGIHPATFDYWKKTNDEFLAKLNEGKIIADMRVVQGFYANCLDRWVDEEETHIFKGKPITVTKKRFIPGDKWAQNKWLALRQRALWSETQKVEITNTNININQISIEGITIEELRLLQSIGMKQLLQNNADNDADGQG